MEAVVVSTEVKETTPVVQAAAEESKAVVQPPKTKWGDEPVDEIDLDGLTIDDGKKLNESDEKKVNDVVEERIEKVIEDGLYTSDKTFEDLNISEPLRRGLYSEMGFTRPSRIQAESLPLILDPPNSNLVAQAQNGSGKTTCFTLGMLSRVDPSLAEPQALCLCPTRELALQNEAVLTKMGKYTGIKAVCAIPPQDGRYGASSRRSAVHEQVVIGTPGTLKKWVSVDRSLSLKHVKILVFDEADQMLDAGGFQEDSMRLMKHIKSTAYSCQILLFSATFSERVKEFVKRNIPNANHVFVKETELSLDVIKQYRVKCPNSEARFEVLKERIYPVAEKLGQSIIFARTRETVIDLHRKLMDDGYPCTSIHGQLKPDQRDKTIQEFRDGITRILIATDVLARGFDVAQVTLVVNYDLPELSHQRYRKPDFAAYLHRIGRSGRFGRKGAAFNMVVNADDERLLCEIEQHFSRAIPEVPWDDEDAFEQVLKDAGLA